jgi:hypothetical protein
MAGINLQRLLLVLAYAASIVAPSAHHLLTRDADSCAVCRVLCTDAVVLVGPGDGAPCSGPVHHHPSHDEGKCTICLTAGLAQWHVAPFIAIELGGAPTALPPDVSDRLVHRTGLHRSHARAPPRRA